jgi:putative phage-type endonuclease
MLTESQRLERRNHIGSSDVGCLFRLDPFKTVGQLWLEKTGRLEPEKEQSAHKRGHWVEPGLIDFAKDYLGDPSIVRKVRVIGSDPLFASNLDAAVITDDSCGFRDRDFSDQPTIRTDTEHILRFSAVIEAKSASGYAVDIAQWGDEGTDQVPERVILQCQIQMFCAGCDVAYVPALDVSRRRFDYKMYRVSRSEKIIESIIEAGHDFWDRYVKTDTQPDDFQVALAVLKRIRREPESEVEVEDTLVNLWLEAKEQLAEADTRKENAERNLVATLGDAEAGRCSFGLFTYLSQTKRSGPSVKECERLGLDSLIRESDPFRVARFKANKAR